MAGRHKGRAGGIGSLEQAKRGGGGECGVGVARPWSRRLTGPAVDGKLTRKSKWERNDMGSRTHRMYEHFGAVVRRE